MRKNKSTASKKRAHSSSGSNRMGDDNANGEREIIESVHLTNQSSFSMTEVPKESLTTYPSPTASIIL